MAISTFTIDINNQSQLSEDDEDYGTVHNDATGAVAKLSHTRIGQFYSAGTGVYYIYRYALGFDTSALDDDTLIQSAYITGYATTGGSAETAVLLKDGTPDYPHIPIPVSADYNFANYSGNGGTGTVPLTSYKKFTIDFNYTGLTWISKTGYSKFLIIGQDDNISTEPTGMECADFYTYDATAPAYYLKLTVVHFSPTGIPVVGDPTFSGTKDTFTTATANVSNTGGGYDERGFEYGITETPTWSVSETGVWGSTGNFSLIISSLYPPETTYYARAYAKNDYGTGYSGWKPFTTTASPSYGMYEEENAATICFYVRKVGGKWSIKHGPYTTDQANVEITKILIEGKGKYQIKFESDVLTGISAGVMCKIDIKARG